jgi:hypothetical protein
MALVLSRVRPVAWYAAAFAGAWGLMFLGRALGGDLRLPLLCLGAGWGFVCALLAWRVTDEAARTAHKSAWFWGGATALPLSLAAAFFPGAGEAIAAFIAESMQRPLPAFVAGIFFVVALQVVGYALVWAGWWAAKR